MPRRRLRARLTAGWVWIEFCAQCARRCVRRSAGRRCSRWVSSRSSLRRVVMAGAGLYIEKYRPYKPFHPFPDPAAVLHFAQRKIHLSGRRNRRTTLTTHVLDTATAGCRHAVKVFPPDGGRRELLRAVTNHDGAATSPAGGRRAGAQQLRDRVAAGDYFRALGLGCPSRCSSMRSYCASASPTRRPVTTCRCWSRRGAIPPTAVPERRGTPWKAISPRLGQPAAALAAPDHRHRLDRRVVFLLRDAGQLPCARPATRPTLGAACSASCGGARGGFIAARSSSPAPGEPPSARISHWSKWEAYHHLAVGHEPAGR